MKYIVDTNILLEHPEILKIPDFEIILTYSVILELDSKKSTPGSVGYNSRLASNILDEARTRGDLTAGVAMECGSWIAVVMDAPGIYADDSIVELAASLVADGHRCTVLSNDINVRIKSAINGVTASGWGREMAGKAEYTKIPEVYVSDAVVSVMFGKGRIDASELPDVPAYSYALLRSDVRVNSTAIVFNNGTEIEVVGNKPRALFGLKPKNIDQTCAIDALLRDKIPLVTLTGPAGSGKSLLAVAAALDALLERRTVDRIMIIRPTIPVGKDIGFLPGSLSEKLAAWAGPIYDNLRILMKGNEKNLDMYFENGTIEVVPTTFLRGRSLNRVFVILDEGQGLTAHEMKTVATRIGEDSRLVITGDLEQIDNPRVSIGDNGLALITEAFRGTEWAVCLDLLRGERSGFASAAAEKL